MATNPIAEDVKTGATTAIKITAEIAASYIPLVAAVKTLFDEIHKIYENAECNKEMCTIMTERIEAAMYALQKMMRKDDNYIYEKEYSLSLKKFVKVLTEIKDFTDKVSKLEGVRKLFEAGKIKQQFYKLIQDYDICMKELQFAMAITNENEREEEAKRIEKALKDLEKLEYGVKIANNKLDGLAEDISFIKNKMSDAQAQKIKLSEPLTGCVKRNSVIKKFYVGTAVACKPIDDSEKHQATLAILEKLSLSPCILKFYGLSEFDNHTYMVFDWAEYGNLKELYDSFDIPWTRKIIFIRDICRGLVFLRELDILHHDIRCENIFICEGLSPKLGNFIHARKANANTSFLSFQKQIEMFRWMAPEQIEKYQNNPKQKGYTFSCEMFSFGMLIWELCYEKIPYKRYSDPKKISKHVVIGKREKLLLGKPNDIKIQEHFIKIIDKAWQHMPEKRIVLLDLHRKLEKLADTYPIPLDGPLLLKDKELDLGANEPTIDLNEGIRCHQKKEYENAWKCFEENANFGNPIAKYWQGYYLFNGYLKTDKELAYKLFKEVADTDDVEEYQDTVSDEQYQNAISDAPYRYAVSLLNDANKRVENRDKILHYLELAKNNNNPEAMYLLGDIYVNGKLKMEKDIKLGKEYLNLTLKYSGPIREDAINLLKEVNEKN